MSAVPLSYGAYKRSLSPEAILLNCYVEKAPTQQAQPFAIRARGGFTAFKQVGTAPIRGFFAKEGLFGNSVLVTDATSVNLMDTSGALTALAGTVSGSGLVDIDAGQDTDLNSIARIATTSGLHLVSGSAVTAEDFPDNTRPGCSSVAQHRGFWLGVEAGTDQVFDQVPGDITWDALSFASAEYSPDPLRAVRPRGDQIALLGSATTEIWSLTGSASPAIAPYGGLNFDFGCRARDTAVNVAGALIWVDHQCAVRMFEGGDASIISDNGLSEQIRLVSANDLRASWYIEDQHVFYQLTLGASATWCYDLSTKEWHRRSSLGRDFLTQHLYASVAGSTFAADTLTNQIYTVDPDARTDAGTAFPVEFTAFAEVLEGNVQCGNVELICEVGNAPRTGQGSDPVISMRMSRDGGKTFGRWMDRPLGATGQSNTRVRWVALGQISAPYGAIFHFRVTDPVGRRFSNLMMNAP